MTVYEAVEEHCCVFGHSGHFNVSNEVIRRGAWPLEHQNPVAAHRRNRIIRRIGQKRSDAPFGPRGEIRFEVDPFGRPLGGFECPPLDTYRQ